MALLRGQGHRGIPLTKTNREPSARGTAQAEQRRGRHVPVQFPHTQRQDPIQGLVKATYAGICPCHVDEPPKGGNIPVISISKIDFCPFRDSQRGVRLASDDFYKYFPCQSLLLRITPNDHDSHTGFQKCHFLKWAQLNNPRDPFTLCLTFKKQ